MELEKKESVAALYYCWASSRLDRLWRVDHSPGSYNEGREFAG